MIKVLDHGYVRLVEAWGQGDTFTQGFEAGIIEAARMSTGKGFEGWEKDQRLLSFLYNNKHMTPFEMAGMTIEVAAPIFVFREWHRHRTQSYNEMSGRYVPLPDTNYMPTMERVLGAAQTAGGNRQAQGTSNFNMTIDSVAVDREYLQIMYEKQEELYQQLLTHGWPKELARLCLPVARYSRMRASTDLRNWLAFLTLRMAPNAQWEIRQYANAVGEMIKINFPRTWELFNVSL